MRLAGKSQLDSRELKRLIALSCILLALVMTGLEAAHSHSDAAVSRNSSPCAICISAHANAPAVTVHFLPELYTVETVAIAFSPEGKSAAPELQLFIRPPPIA
jgi:hypothetical protein